MVPPRGATLIANDCEGCAIHVCTDLKAAAEPWKIFQKTAEMTPFQRYEWLRHWFECVADHKRTKPFIVLVYEAGVLRLIAPLAIESGAVASRLLWMGHRANDHNAPLVDGAWLDAFGPERAARLWRRITRAPEGVDYVHLIRHPSHLGAHRNPFVGDAPSRYSSDSHFLTLAGDWPVFYRGLRGSKSRRRLREKLKRLRKVGRVGFRSVRNPIYGRAMIALLLDWKQDQLARRGARNPFSDGGLARQLFALCGDSAARDMMRVYVLEVDGRPVAGAVALIQGGTFNFFISAYNDVGLRNCSPGTIMLVKLIELAARAGFTKFDFSLGDEAYKAEWCDTRVEITHQTEALSALGVGLAALTRLGLTLKRGIKTNPRALAALEFVNARRTAILRRLGVLTVRETPPAPPAMVPTTEQTSAERLRSAIDNYKERIR